MTEPSGNAWRGRPEYFNFWMLIPFLGILSRSPGRKKFLVLLCLFLLLKGLNKSGTLTLVPGLRSLAMSLLRCECSVSLKSNPHDRALGQLEKEKMREFLELSMAEESFLKQKSRVKWLNFGLLGDKNCKYFFHRMCNQRTKHTVLSLDDSNGRKLEDPEAIKEEILGIIRLCLGILVVIKRMPEMFWSLLFKQRYGGRQSYACSTCFHGS